MLIPWQAFALGSVTASGLQDIADKRALQGAVDPTVATFVRVTLYVVLIVPLIVVLRQGLVWYMSPGLLLCALANALVAGAYTVLLQRIHISTLGVLAYAAPLLFLAVDHWSGNAITPLHAMGVVGLVVGGIAFALDDRLQLSPTTILALVWTVGITGVEAYYVKHVHAQTGVPIVSLFANIWGWAAAVLGVVVVARGKAALVPTRATWTYLRWSVLGKGCDVSSSLCWSMGITATTVAQFAAMEVWFPPILLLLTTGAQRFLGMELGEVVHRRALWRKGAAALLLVGSSLVV